MKLLAVNGGELPLTPQHPTPSPEGEGVQG